MAPLGIRSNFDPEINAPRHICVCCQTTPVMWQSAVDSLEMVSTKRTALAHNSRPLGDRLSPWVTRRYLANKAEEGPAAVQ